MKNPTINSPALRIMQHHENAPFTPAEQSELEWLARMRDELRAERIRHHQLMQLARLNAARVALR